MAEFGIYRQDGWLLGVESANDVRELAQKLAAEGRAPCMVFQPPDEFWQVWPSGGLSLPTRLVEVGPEGIPPPRTLEDLRAELARPPSPVDDPNPESPKAG